MAAGNGNANGSPGGSSIEINIEALASEFTEHVIVLPDKNKSRLRQPSGTWMRRLDEAKGGEGSALLFWEMAAWLLPDAPPESVDRLTVSQILKLMEVASQNADQVMALIREAAPEPEHADRPPALAS